MLVESREILDHAKQQLMQHTIHLTSLVTSSLRFSFNIPLPTKTKNKALIKMTQQNITCDLPAG
jgi:hypothetical protein